MINHYLCNINSNIDNMPNPWRNHILMVTPPRTELDSERNRAMAELGIEITSLSPTLFSAFTAMSIASETNKHRVDVVHTFREKDALAAASARKVSKHPDFKIILELLPNQPTPHNLTKELQREIDGWICASGSQRAKAAPGSAPCIVTQPRKATVPKTSEGLTPMCLLWMGPIGKNVDQLKQAIECVDRAEGKIKLSIAGTGKARYVMQAVQKSRSISRTESVVWLGDDFDLKKLLSDSDGIVQSQSDATAAELDACSGLGLPLYLPSERKFVRSPIVVATPRERALKVQDFYHSL